MDELANHRVNIVYWKWLKGIYLKAQNGNKEKVLAYEHPGGHMVPNKKDIIRPIVEQITSSLQEASE